MKFSFALFVWSALSLATEAGHVVALYGKVLASNRLLRNGDAVYESEILRTEMRSGAKLLMADQSVLNLSESTTVSLKKYPAVAAGEPEVDLEYGQVRAVISRRVSQAGKRFNFKTKWGMVLVKGTELVLSDIEGNFSVTVMEGFADVLLPSSSGRLEPVNLIAGRRLFLTDLDSILQGVRFPSTETISPEEIIQVRENIAQNEKRADSFDSIVNDRKDSGDAPPPEVRDIAADKGGAENVPDRGGAKSDEKVKTTTQRIEEQSVPSAEEELISFSDTRSTYFGLQNPTAAATSGYLSSIGKAASGIGTAGSSSSQAPATVVPSGTLTLTFVP